MDVFKTHVGGWGAMPISEENFARYTNLRAPYVLEQANRRNSFFAVCPECDNPIQLIGLYTNQEDSHGRPYGRHVRHSIPRLARYVEEEYLACPYADPRYRRDEGRRLVTSRVGLALRDLMRDRFDLIADDWERSTGLHLGVKYAAKMLGKWKDNQGWLFFMATRRNLPWALFTGVKAQPLVGHWIRRNSELCRKLATLDCIRLEDVAMQYVRVTPIVPGYVDLSFILWKRRISVRDERAYETYRMRVMLEGNSVGKDLVIEADDHYLGESPSRRDQRLLDVARKVLGD